MKTLKLASAPVRMVRMKTRKGFSARRFMALLLPLVALAASISVASAGPASAASGVNIVIGNWHCSQGGSIAWSQGLNAFPSGDTKGTVSGNRYNDVGVWYNSTNTYSATVYCQGWVWKGWYWSYVRYYQYIYPGQQNFWPAYAGQTFYL